MALYLKFKPKPQPLNLLRPFSSSFSSPPPPNPPPPNVENTPSNDRRQPQPPPNSEHNRLFSDIKQHLKSPPKPHNPLFSQNPNQKPPSISFQDLLVKSTLLNKPPSSNQSPTRAGESLSFESIRQSLHSFQQSSPSPSTNRLGPKSYRDLLQPRGIRDQPLPDNIFGRELREKANAANSEKTPISLKPYSYDDLGKKLRMLRPDGAKGDSKDGDWFSIEELNQRLQKLMEMDEEEKTPLTGLLDSLQRSKLDEAKKKANMPRVSILGNLGSIGKLGTPKYLLETPQEHLLEKYFHPDHMSSEEKMKVELQKVRDEFKMHENDCGSARVQVATLTTKIKHLSSVLHKKDKHSRKGLQDMVQLRKKLLKYLRRTDWDSYCLVLSRLGLRDVPEYKAPDYKKKVPDSKTKTKTKTKKKMKA